MRTQARRYTQVSVGSGTRGGASAFSRRPARCGWRRPRAAPSLRCRGAGRAVRPRRARRRPSTSTTSRTCSGVTRAAVTVPLSSPSGSTRNAERRTASRGAGWSVTSCRTGPLVGGSAGTSVLPPRRTSPAPRRRPRAPGRSRGRARSAGSAGARHTSSISPCWTISPARITASRSATVNASSWSWVTISAVVPSWLRIARRSVASRWRSPVSRADSGSSSSSSRGRTARQRASATRCRSPPERVAGSRSAYPSRPTSASSSSTRAPMPGARRSRRA